MTLKELELKIRINKKNGAIDANIPRKEFSTEELDKIQEKKSIKILMESI